MKEALEIASSLNAQNLNQWDHQCEEMSADQAKCLSQRGSQCSYCEFCCKSGSLFLSVSGHISWRCIQRRWNRSAFVSSSRRTDRWPLSSDLDNNNNRTEWLSCFALLQCPRHLQTEAACHQQIWETRFFRKIEHWIRNHWEGIFCYVRWNKKSCMDIRTTRSSYQRLYKHWYSQGPGYHMGQLDNFPGRKWVMIWILKRCRD